MGLNEGTHITVEERACVSAVYERDREKRGKKREERESIVAEQPVQELYDNHREMLE